MSVYLYGFKKIAPVEVTLPSGEKVFVCRKLVFKTGNACSFRDADSKRVEGFCKRLLASFGPRFEGYVLAGDLRDGVAVIKWDGAPYWFDCDKYKGPKVAFLFKQGKRYVAHSSCIECYSSVDGKGYMFPGDNEGNCLVAWRDDLRVSNIFKVDA